MGSTVQLETVAFPHGEALLSWQGSSLVVANFTGDRQGLEELLTYAEERGATSFLLQCFRKALLPHLADLLSSCPNWRGPEVAGYILRIDKCLSN